MQATAAYIKVVICLGGMLQEPRNVLQNDNVHGAILPRLRQLGLQPRQLSRRQRRSAGRQRSLVDTRRRR